MTADASPEPDGRSQRLDKWLWRARFFKTRTLAAKLCNAGHVRSGGNAVTKAHHQVRVGAVLTFALGRYIRVIKVLALGDRRGPAPEARTLYEDLKPPATSQAMPAAAAGHPAAGHPAVGHPAAGQRAAGAGRPTKRERRRIDQLRRGSE
jgi:ribosome-associated heat shock protein Hsp15